MSYGLCVRIKTACENLEWCTHSVCGIFYGDRKRNADEETRLIERILIALAAHSLLLRSNGKNMIIVILLNEKTRSKREKKYTRLVGGQAKHRTRK